MPMSMLYIIHMIIIDLENDVLITIFHFIFFLFFQKIDIQWRQWLLTHKQVKTHHRFKYSKSSKRKMYIKDGQCAQIVSNMQAKKCYDSTNEIHTLSMAYVLIKNEKLTICKGPTLNYKFCYLFRADRERINMFEIHVILSAHYDIL